MTLDTLLPKLEDSASMPSKKELATLSGISGAEREQFLRVWRGLSIERRRNVTDTLAELAGDNVDLDFSNVFKIGLFDDDVQVRADSIEALWECEDDDLVGVLLRLLNDPEAIVRGEAALALGRFLLRAELDGIEDDRTEAIEQKLGEVFRNEDETPEVRGRAIEALGVRSNEWVRELIEDAYSDGDRRLKISAVHAMGRSADPEWLPIVAEEMQSEDGEMRFEAAAAAGAIGEEDAIPDLTALTADEDPEVRAAAIASLGLIGGGAARSALHAVAAETSDESTLELVRDALSEADFADDPLGVKLYLDQSVAEDTEEEDE